MIDAGRLLADLKKLRKKLEEDLRSHHRVSEQRAAIESEWREALNTKRTADTFDTFFGLRSTRRRCIGSSRSSSSGSWRTIVCSTDRLSPGLANDWRWRSSASGSGFGRGLKTATPNTYWLCSGTLLGFQASRGCSTRFTIRYSGSQFLATGRSLYSTFSVNARRTPENCSTTSPTRTGTRASLATSTRTCQRRRENASRCFRRPSSSRGGSSLATLDPAIREFGHEQVRMIDPTCGSGHFLLGGFARLLEEWRRHAPEMPPAALAQKPLDAVAGVDLNPFAVEIARFRLLVAALQAAGETRLAAAPDFRLHLAIGDSLLHGQHFLARARRDRRGLPAHLEAPLRGRGHVGARFPSSGASTTL